MKLAKNDRAELSMQRKGKPLSARTWRRVRVLELLDQGMSVRGTAKAVVCLDENPIVLHGSTREGRGSR